MTKKTRNWLVLFISIPAAVVIAMVGLLIFDVARPLPPTLPLPNPNGYDDLVKAGQMVPNDAGDYNKMDETQLRQVVAKNVAAFSFAHSGFSNECRVPLQFSTNYFYIHLDQLSGLKQLARSFVAEGRLAEIESRPNDAAKSYLDVIHLANESARGGVLIDELVGTAIEAVGTSHLQKLVPQLDAKSACETAAALETLDAQRQSWNEVMQQENTWSRRTFQGVGYRLAELVMHNSLNKARQIAERKFKELKKKTQQLIIDLAARAYELDKGHRPASLADLVPDYLKAIPQDPFTGTNMVYSSE